MSEYTIRHEGDRCIVIDLGHVIDEVTGLRCLALANQLRQQNIPGVRDIVASYVCVAVHYLPHAALGADPAHTITQSIQQAFDSLTEQPDLRKIGQTIAIPICYGGVHGPDLNEAAEQAGLSPTAFIEAHHAQVLRVFMLGFAPGQPYIGVHDERFSIPRKAVPRTAVAAGSLGIANRQSTLYPNTLPGGWMIVGATPIPLFDAQADRPSLLNPGDTVQFVPIREAQFETLWQKHRTRESVS